MRMPPSDASVSGDPSAEAKGPHRRERNSCSVQDSLPVGFLHYSEERRFRVLADEIPVGTAVFDSQDRLLYVNGAFFRICGCDEKEPEYLRDWIRQAIPEVLSHSVRTSVREDGCDIRSDLTELEVTGCDGTGKVLRWRVCPLAGGERLLVCEDITAFTRALREAQARHQLLVDSAQDGVAYVDAQGVIQFANPRMKSILQDPSPEGRNLREYYDEENRRLLEEHLGIRNTGESSTYFITLTDRTGQQHHMVVSGAPFFDQDGDYRGAIGIFTDISELKKLEAQLQQSQKMEAVGTLAGGVAHDFNNILSGVLGYASLIKRHSPPDSQTGHFAEMIEKSAQRGASLAGQLLAFSRKGKRFIQSVDVHRIIDDVAEILVRTLDPRISIEIVKKADKSMIQGDSSLLQQMMMNLCINANDAMPDGGRLIVSTSTLEVGKTVARSFERLAPGTYVVIRVEDTGQGMTEQIKQRIFEPFFTTKEEGKGTGLGLSMVYGAVRNHGGDVRVYSESQRGTVFKVLLPVEESPQLSEPRSESSEVSEGTGTILLVDDEAILRSVVKEMLEEIGFRVFTAEDGRSAVSLYRDHWREIGLVILDMVMPGLTGTETFAAMKQINPDVRAIISTGFSEDVVAGDRWEAGIMRLLQKPYSVADLSDAVSKSLAGQPSKRV